MYIDRCFTFYTIVFPCSYWHALFRKVCIKAVDCSREEFQSDKDFCMDLFRSIHTMFSSDFADHFMELSGILIWDVENHGG